MAGYKQWSLYGNRTIKERRIQKNVIIKGKGKNRGWKYKNLQTERHRSCDDIPRNNKRRDENIMERSKDVNIDKHWEKIRNIIFKEAKQYVEYKINRNRKQT